MAPSIHNQSPNAQKIRPQKICHAQGRHQQDNPGKIRYSSVLVQENTPILAPNTGSKKPILTTSNSIFITGTSLNNFSTLSNQ